MDKQELSNGFIDDLLKQKTTMKQIISFIFIFLFFLVCTCTDTFSTPEKEELLWSGDTNITAESAFTYDPNNNILTVPSKSTTVEIVTYFTIEEDLVKDVTWALETLMKLSPGVSTEGDNFTITPSILTVTSPAAELRAKADAIEKNDKDIKRAREIIKRWKGVTE